MLKMTGQKLVNLMFEYKVDVNKFSELTGLSRSYIYKLRTGERKISKGNRLLLEAVFNQLEEKS